MVWANKASKFNYYLPGYLLHKNFYHPHLFHKNLLVLRSIISFVQVTTDHLSLMYSHKFITTHSLDRLLLSLGVDTST